MRGHPYILVVDDDPGICELVEAILTTYGHDVVCAHSSVDALRISSEREPALVILDLKMPGLDGEGFLALYQQRSSPSAPVILLSAAQEVDDVAARIEGAVPLAKPFGIEDLLTAVDAALGYAR